MLISLSRRFIFVANMKSASSAVEAALSWAAEIAVSESRYGKHQTLEELAIRFAWLFATVGLEQFFKFGVIRDPVEYVISLYNSHMHPKFANSDLYTGDLDFDGFLNEWAPLHPDQIVEQHLRFLDANGQIGVNYLISHDRLREGLKIIENLVGVIAKPLRTVNASFGSFKPCHLSEKQLAWVEDHFQQDRVVLESHCNHLLHQWSPAELCNIAPLEASDVSLQEWLSEANSERSPGHPIQDEALVRALYRMLLLREPDISGLKTYVTQIRNGISLEEILHAFLSSHEFSERQSAFLRIYLSNKLST